MAPNSGRSENLPTPTRKCRSEIATLPRHKRSAKSALLQALELSRLEFAQDTPFRFAVLLALNFRVQKPRFLKDLQI
jgi:hypothetical protein